MLERGLHSAPKQTTFLRIHFSSFLILDSRSLILSEAKYIARKHVHATSRSLKQIAENETEGEHRNIIAVLQ